MGRDTIFRDEHPEISAFAFDERVASVFADMLKRSVPGYGTMLSLLAVFVRKYAQENSNIYDLGCSLGASSLAMAGNILVPNCKILAYDTSEAMIDRFRHILTDVVVDKPIESFVGDVCDVEYEKVSLAVLNLTLQFIDPEKRLPLLKKIYNATLPGGVLILAEKISDTSDDGLFTDLYYTFKRANNYSELEISQKRTALENVLITDTEEVHIERLKMAGFSRVERWFQTLNFRAYAAWK